MLGLDRRAKKEIEKGGIASRRVVALEEATKVAKDMHERTMRRVEDEWRERCVEREKKLVGEVEERVTEKVTEKVTMKVTEEATKKVTKEVEDLVRRQCGRTWEEARKEMASQHETEMTLLTLETTKKNEMLMMKKIEIITSDHAIEMKYLMLCPWRTKQ